MGEGALALNHPDARTPLLRLCSDARLARLAASGSTAAFAAIYRRHYQAIYRYCRSLLGNEHDARDALQNTMIKAMSALEGETRDIKLRPWLFRIAHNESVSLMRRRPPEVGIDAVAEVDSGASDVEARQRLRALLADLGQLTERQRGALVMRELSGLEFEEIAAALDTSPEAAKQALYEARLALRDLERGREMSCDEVCRRISEHDRRRLRGREVRAHLKACGDCRAFAEQMRSRRAALPVVAPPLPAPAAVAILEGITGGGGGAAVGAGGAAIGGGATVAGLGGGAAAKIGVAAVVALGLGGAAIETSKTARPAEAAKAAEGDGRSGPHASGDRHVSAIAGHGGRNGAAGEADSGAGGAKAPQAAGQGPPATPPGHGGTPPGQSGNAPGQAGTAPGLSGSAPGHSGANPGNSAAAPGHGGTPPGQGGTPPGQSGAPGNSAAAPGIAGTTPPDQGATPQGPSAGGPGNSGAAPGHGGTPPGHGGTPPGQSGN